MKIINIYTCALLSGEARADRQLKIAVAVSAEIRDKTKKRQGGDASGS